MRLCFSTLGCTELSLKEALRLAEKYSISGIEIRGLNGIMDNTKIPELNEKNAECTKRLFEDYGVIPTVLGTSCRFHTKELCFKAIEEGKASIDIASRLSIPFIRVFGNNMTENEAECVQLITEGISNLCSYARERNVTVLLEVHGDFNSIGSLAPITEQSEQNASFGLLWDIAHTHDIYKNDWIDFYNYFKSLIRHVHIKDKASDGRLALPGEGEIPIMPIIERMISDGFNGFFSLEWERKWHPELVELPLALEKFSELTK